MIYNYLKSFDFLLMSLGYTHTHTHKKNLLLVQLSVCSPHYFNIIILSFQFTSRSFYLYIYISVHISNVATLLLSFTHIFNIKIVVAMHELAHRYFWITQQTIYSWNDMKKQAFDERNDRQPNRVIWFQQISLFFRYATRHRIQYCWWYHFIDTNKIDGEPNTTYFRWI